MLAQVKVTSFRLQCEDLVRVLTEYEGGIKRVTDFDVIAESFPPYCKRVVSDRFIFPEGLF